MPTADPVDERGGDHSRSIHIHDRTICRCRNLAHARSSRHGSTVEDHYDSAPYGAPWIFRRTGHDHCALPGPTGGDSCRTVESARTRPRDPGQRSLNGDRVKIGRPPTAHSRSQEARSSTCWCQHTEDRRASTNRRARHHDPNTEPHHLRARAIQLTHRSRDLLGCVIRHGVTDRFELDPMAWYYGIYNSCYIATKSI